MDSLADWTLDFPDIGLAMDDSALQIGLVNCVEIDDAEGADASRCEVGSSAGLLHFRRRSPRCGAFFSRFKPSIPTSGMIK